jgi:beta-mannosidase
MIFGWYQSIFNDLIPGYLHVLDQTRPYLASSPLHGFGHPESYTEGDSHYYGVWAETAPIENYTNHVGRFMSEYGMQGWPSLNTVNKYTLPEDRWINSSVIQFHEKGAAGYYHVEYYILNYFNNATNFEKYLYLTQIMQSYAIQTAVEAHRYNKPRNMGTLMWQLNDDWPSFSWSSRDYYGAWKAVHYMVKRKFQDVIVSVVPTNNNTQYQVYVVSEKLTDFNANLSVVIMDISGTVAYSKSLQIKCPAGQSVSQLVISNQDFSKLDLARNFIYANVTYDFGETLSETTAYFVRPKNLQLANATITMKIDVLKNLITVESDTLAIGVNVYSPAYDIFLDDNYFDLLPNTPKTVKFLRFSLLDAPNALFKILHLYSSYNDNASEPKVTYVDPRKDSTLMKSKLRLSILEK